MSILLAATTTGILLPLETYFFNVWGAGGGGSGGVSSDGSTGAGGAFLEVEVQRIPPGMQFEMVRGGAGSRGAYDDLGAGGGACSILIAKYDSESKAIAIAGGGGGAGSGLSQTGYSNKLRFAYGGPGGPGTAVGGSPIHGRSSFYYSTDDLWNSGTDHPHSGRGGISGTESSVGSGRDGTDGQPLSVYASSGGDGQQRDNSYTSGGSLPISSGGAGGRGTEGGRGSQSAALQSRGAGGGGGGYLGGEGGEAKVTIGQDSEDVRVHGGGGGGGGGSAVLVDNGFLQSINSEGELRVGGYPLVIILRGTSHGGYQNLNPNHYLAPAQAEIVSNLGTFNTPSQTDGYYNPQYGSGGKGYGRLSVAHSNEQREPKDGQPGAIIYGKSSADATILSTYGTTTITI